MLLSASVRISTSLCVRRRLHVSHEYVDAKASSDGLMVYGFGAVPTASYFPWDSLRLCSLHL